MAFNTGDSTKLTKPSLVLLLLPLPLSNGVPLLPGVPPPHPTPGPPIQVRTGYGIGANPLSSWGGGVDSRKEIKSDGD